jgi:hypothetical protein
MHYTEKTKSGKNFVRKENQLVRRMRSYYDVTYPSTRAGAPSLDSASPSEVPVATPKVPPTAVGPAKVQAVEWAPCRLLHLPRDPQDLRDRRTSSGELLFCWRGVGELPHLEVRRSDMNTEYFQAFLDPRHRPTASFQAFASWCRADGRREVPGLWR